MTKRNVLVGIDVGGTFTDIFTLDQSTGEVGVHKVASTRGREAEGFFGGVLVGEPELERVAAIIHGTTVGTNALLEHKGALTGFVATEGFRDVLQMRRRDRPTTWGLRGEYRPVVERSMCVEVKERVGADGSLLTELDEASLKERICELLEKGAEAIAVVFINAYANDENERKARYVIEKMWPNRHISISSELLPEIREFERASTTALNAYLQPIVGDYLHQLAAGLNDHGFGGEFLIVQSNGGLINAETAAKTPVRTALSGPAAGVCASARIAAEAGFENIITCDLGGTSFDVSLVADGEAAVAQQSSVDFGLVIRSPMTEITTIGAGGGSIAWIDAGDMLQIGPESAGSDPGPVCYGKGNDRPTVSDANVVLGRINPENPIGALKKLDIDAAKKAIKDHVAEPLGMDVMAAAEAIIDITNAKMAGAIRLVSIERGHDPRKFAAMPFGGGGSLHCCALVREIGLKSALVPRYPGIVSALGCVIADMRLDFVRTLNQPLESIDLQMMTKQIQQFADQGEQQLQRSKAEFSSISINVVLDMLYSGQSHSIQTVLPDHCLNCLTVENIQEAFDSCYLAINGQLLDGVEALIANLRVAVMGLRPKFDLSTLAPSPEMSLDTAYIGARSVYFRGNICETVVYSRLGLPSGAEIRGPAILEQGDSTVWIEPEFLARVDRLGNLIVELETF